MDRDELTKALRGVDHMSVEDCFLLSPLFGRAADLIDQQAARIAELEDKLHAAVECHEKAEDEREKAEAERDAAWIAGRDAAAEAVERAPTVNVQAQKGPGWEVLVTTPSVPYPQMIRALTPPETQP